MAASAAVSSWLEESLIVKAEKSASDFFSNMARVVRATFFCKDKHWDSRKIFFIKRQPQAGRETASCRGAYRLWASAPPSRRRRKS